ncbi:hypothetical protein GCM10023091_27550 [Ravibacter arvi]|uniref:N-acetylneuraminate epimerase n=1 Tax=Ravibacter arvi TaxID=2051041 RepID=A0ABP8M2B3_9BACT
MISGQNLASNLSDNIIKVGGVPVTFVERLNEFGAISTDGGKTQILLTCVPPGAQSGEVTLTVGDQTLEMGGLVIHTYGSGGAWKQVKDYPGIGAGIDQKGFVINNKIYTGFAINPESNQPCLLAFDPATNKWERKADFPGGARTAFVAFGVGGKGYVGLGNRGDASSLTDSFEKDFWEYDPSTDKWTKKADFPGNRRSGAYSMSIGGRGYVGGGLDVAIKIVNDFWEYNPNSDSWQKKKSFPRIEAFSYGVNHEIPITFSSKNFGYFISGEMADIYGLKYACWLYSPGDDDWYYIPQIPLPEIPANLSQTGFWSKIFTFGFSIDDKVYIGAPNAYYKGDKPGNFFVFDEQTLQWTKLADYPGWTGRSAYYVVGRKAYVGLDHLQSDLWEFAP